MLATRVRTIKNEDITIPNSLVLGGAMTNYSRQASELGLILHTSVTIGYDAPWRKIHGLLIEAALATPQHPRDAAAVRLADGAERFLRHLRDQRLHRERPRHDRRPTPCCTPTSRTGSSPRASRSCRRITPRSATATRCRYRKPSGRPATAHPHSASSRSRRNRSRGPAHDSRPGARAAHRGKRAVRSRRSALPDRAEGNSRRPRQGPTVRTRPSSAAAIRACRRSWSSTPASESCSSCAWPATSSLPRSWARCSTRACTCKRRSSS